SDLIHRPESLRRTQVLKSMKIGSLSPRPPGGGPTFREGWGEGEKISSLTQKKPTTTIKKAPHQSLGGGLLCISSRQIKP
ncbi:MULTISPECIES: hypothetical protein, partial [unclassified Pseudomonas]|uniref:hypothetical protein n=1 Tax=unclassified Pseudomonas TaxID=196821 RepID=UPI001F59DD1F